MAEDVQPDQAVYDARLAAGDSERVARAKAKAATQRRVRADEGWAIGPRSQEDASAALQEFRSNREGGGDTAVATATQEAEAGGGGRLTPEERAARVAASLGEVNGKQASIGVPRSAEHTHRLLALVPPAGIQQVQAKQQDKVYTWPHLLLVEFVALLAVGSLVMVVSYFIDPAFRELANPNLTPNPSKAPWYFLGLQELLRYFHPMVAGVTIPGVGLVMLGATAYFDKNPSAKPENRKFAAMAMTFFLVFWTMLVYSGSFFRGPGFNWIWPWQNGLFFEL